MAKRKTSRAFLNEDKYEIAHVSWQVEDGYANFRLSDCFRCVELDFSHGGEKSKAKALKKLAVLEGELSKFATELRKRCN